MPYKGGPFILIIVIIVPTVIIIGNDTLQVGPKATRTRIPMLMNISVPPTATLSIRSAPC